MSTLGQAIAGGALDQLGQLVAACKGQEIPLDEVSWLPVVTDPGQILCIGLNYEEHRLETKRERASHPTVFARFARCQVGHEAPILRPLESTMLDYEGELAIIIGKRGRRIAAENALDHIAGYACYNDASVRDYQRHTTQFHPGKNFPATGAFGPSMVTADEIADYTQLKLETRLNGVVVQSAGLDQLIFTIPELIAYCSTFSELLPGDVIVTGTPGGVGSARQPPLWMKDGDVVEVEISRIGVLRNPVKDEPASAG
jgi:2-keto-4-pentenoate hydratase/2-oxohepta-3-ene-1,7-dioic acid hydratase in catechol pathway